MLYNEHELNPAYIVDWEDDPNKPIVLKIEITEVVEPGGLNHEGLQGYVGELLADACSGYNMTVAKTKDAALSAVENAKG
jgi:hypothetical protein